MRWVPSSSFWKGFLGAVAGVALALLLFHAWQDHAALHVLMGDFIQRSQGQRTIPIVPPTTPPANGSN